MSELSNLFGLMTEETATQKMSDYAHDRTKEIICPLLKTLCNPRCQCFEARIEEDKYVNPEIKERFRAYAYCSNAMFTGRSE